MYQKHVWNKGTHMQSNGEAVSVTSPKAYIFIGSILYIIVSMLRGGGGRGNGESEMLHNYVHEQVVAVVKMMPS